MTQIRLDLNDKMYKDFKDKVKDNKLFIKEVLEELICAYTYEHHKKDMYRSLYIETVEELDKVISKINKKVKENNSTNKGEYDE